MRRIMAIAAAGLLFAAALAAPAQAETCRTRASDVADVGDTITRFFATVERGDIAAARKMTTQRFHAFDVGRHFGETELLNMIENALKQGGKIGFKIEQMEVVVDCNIAWAHWRNPGHIGGNSVTWQESGVLRRAGKSWVFEFLHSERLVPPAGK